MLVHIGSLARSAVLARSGDPERYGLTVLVACLVGLGCSGGSGGGGNSAATISSCSAYCDAIAAKSCDLPLYPSAAECKADECAGLGSAPVRCQGTTRAYYDCRGAQADLCADTGCAAELTADLNCQLGIGGGTGGSGTGTGGAGTGTGGAGTGTGGAGQGGTPGSASGGFTPTAFGARLVVWLDAGRETSAANGTPVITWTDRSGANNNATQPVAASRPRFTAAGINGLPSMTFDGQLTFFQIADSATTRWGTGDFALMVVARGAPNVATNAMLYNKSERPAPYAGINLLLNETRGSVTAKVSFQLDADFYATTRDDFGDATARLFGGRLVAGATTALLEVRVNGARQGMLSVGGAGINIDAPGQATIIGHNGYDPLPGFQAFKGEISEIVAVKGTVTDAELTGLEGYLMTKYGL